VTENKQPSLMTERLVLRPFVLSDALRVQQLAGHSQIAEMTENIPHPYLDGMAEDWIETLGVRWTNQTLAAFALCLKSNSELVGCCSLQLTMAHKRGSMGYWVGIDYWNQGLGTEGASAVVGFGFEQLKLHRIQAMHLTKNPASGAVMRHVGMRHEATMPDYVIQNGQPESMEQYAILSSSMR